MLSRLIMALICLSSLQTNNVTAGKTKQGAKTPTMDVCLYISTLNFSTTLPNSAPATPTTKSSIRRNKTEANLSINIKALKELHQAQKIAQMKIYIQELKEKKLAEEKHAEWVKYVRESNSCGYFPGYAGNNSAFFNQTTNDSWNTTERDPILYNNAGRDHMDF